MTLTERSVSRLGDFMFYAGGLVWVLYALFRYGFNCNVTIRQFLPFHLAAIIPGVLLRHGAGRIVALINRNNTK